MSSNKPCFRGRKAVKSIGKEASSGSFDYALQTRLGDGSATRFAQDDGFVGGLKTFRLAVILKNVLVGCAKNKNCQKSHSLSG
jgi:hypothetical protein